MRLLRPLLRRYMGLPPAISRTQRASEWVAMEDGTRLETVVIQPVDVLRPASCLLLRSEQPLPCDWAALFAERGHVVVTQQCRGRAGSEGSFEPFVFEGGDGADTVDWITRQPWFGGRLGVVGFGYAGFCAWAALARRPEAIDAIAAGLTSRDPYGSLYLGGALQLEWALHLATQLSDGGQADLQRGVLTRPILECDRVTLRRIPWFREWLAHPTRDAYWQERTPELPGAPPPSLLLAGLHHPTLAGQLHDHALLGEARAAPELVLGPWGESPLPRNERTRASDLVKVTARMLMDFFERILQRREEASGRVRIAVGPSGRWLESTRWPPAGSERRTLYLHGADEEGILSVDPPKRGIPPSHFVYDPADARPSLGGASVDRPGALLPPGADWRGDALRFQAGPLESDLDLVGPASVALHVGSDAPATDFTARLLEADAGGRLVLLGEGVARVSGLAADRPRSVQIELHALARRVRAGSCLRLEIASASFPRFDRHPNVDVDLATARSEDARPARHTVHHDADHASQLTFEVLGVSD